MPEPAAPTDRGKTLRRFLTFRNDGRPYALPAEDVLEVVPTPDVARVPRAPASLLGIANLRGVAVPLVSLSGLLGRDMPAAGSASRSIVLNIGQRVAIVVDAVSAFVIIDQEGFEGAGSAWTRERGEAVNGVFRWGEHGEIVKILDIGALLASAFTRQAPASRRRSRQPGEPSAAGTAPAAAHAPWTRYVVFGITGQDYALDLDAVREIVPVPDKPTSVPESEAVVLGMMSYRGGILPLLSMAGLLGLGSAGVPAAGARIVVVGIGAALVGLLVDGTRSILDADPSLVEPLPAMLAARSGGESRIQAVYRGHGGGRLVSILAIDGLFREDIMRRLSTSGLPAARGKAGDGRSSVEESTILVFRLGDEEFGLPIECVEEVALVPERISRLPKAPQFLDGVMNHRGEVLPVIDQRRRFEMPSGASLPSRRLVIVRSGRHRAALIVDGVSEVLRTDSSAIQPAPEMTVDATRYVEGVVNLAERGRLVLLLSPGELLSADERTELDDFRNSNPPLLS